MRPNDRKSGVPIAEANSRVRDYLKKHKARAAKGEVSIRELHQETGLPLGSIHRTDAWTALQERLEKEGRSKRPHRKKAQAYTNKMDETGGTDDEELQRLIKEQKAEPDYDPPPAGKGRRGKVRIRKKA